jgi:hypothetical protein
MAARALVMFFPAFLMFPVSHRTCAVLQGRSD